MTTTKKTTTKKQTTFEKLSAINVNKYVEKKSNLTYLSWANAWSLTKSNCPDATYEIGEMLVDNDLGIMCYTSVTIDGETLTMWLPVMDSKNQAMKKVSYSYTTRYGEKQVAAATAFDINKTIMRCLVKNLAMFGLGIYLYSGDDLPQDTIAQEPIKPTPSKSEVVDIDSPKWEALVNFCKENKAIGYNAVVKKISSSYTLSDNALAEIKKITK